MIRIKPVAAVALVLAMLVPATYAATAESKARKPKQYTIEQFMTST